MQDLKQLIEQGSPELKFKFGGVVWEFVRINPGSFMMGSPADKAGKSVPRKPVRLTRPFYLGRYQVTQSQWQSFMGPNPGRFRGDDLPAGNVKYSAALELCRRFSIALAVNAALPTEAQWEYACRAGTTSRFYAGNEESDLDRIGWYRANSQEMVQRVGQKEPNAWGLFDMLGNLYEPCIDYVTSFAKLNTTDPEGSRHETYGAMRGGFYMDPPERCEASSRSRSTDRFAGMGVRLLIRP